jgi:hypothetical protein
MRSTAMRQEAIEAPCGFTRTSGVRKHAGGLSASTLIAFATCDYTAGVLTHSLPAGQSVRVTVGRGQ